MYARWLSPEKNVHRLTSASRTQPKTPEVARQEDDRYCEGDEQTKHRSNVRLPCSLHASLSYSFDAVIITTLETVKFGTWTERQEIGLDEKDTSGQSGEKKSVRDEKKIEWEARSEVRCYG